MNAEKISYRRHETQSAPLVVLDASVLIKFVAKESGDERSLMLLQRDIREGKIDVAIPPLAYWEIGNWAARKYPQEATRLLSYFMMCGFREMPLDLHTAGTAIEIMRKHKRVSFYDASYHALAMRISATFITADSTYVSETKKLGNICLLSNYAEI